MTRKGQFKPGTSGNPAGRPRASGKTAELRKAIVQHVPAIITKLVEQAKAGDVKAARLLLERVLPAAKPETLPVMLPELGEAEGLAASGANIIKAVSEGRIAPDTAAALLSGLGQQARLVEIDELIRRIEALEQKGQQS